MNAVLLAGWREKLKQLESGSVTSETPQETKVVTTNSRVAWKVDLTAEEADRYKTLLGGDGAGCANPPELLRLLLAREYRRRHGMPKPPASEWQTAHRIGRPKK